MKKHYLKTLFEPGSVAIVGASDEAHSVGGQILRNMQECGFKGEIYPVNPDCEAIQGLPCYPRLRAIDHPIDLVVFAVPAEQIPTMMREAGDLGVRAAIVISAGFAETGPRGESLQNEIVDIAKTHNIPLMGPNCLGIIRPRIGLNATSAKSQVQTGKVALVAQSGAFCTALLDWANSEGFGFSAVASLGATADVGFGDVLDYLAVDPETKSILLYVEGVNDARSFISGLRVAARLKPVVVVKSGRSESGTRAAVSHTGALVGSDAVFDSVVERAGAVRVHTVSQLFAAARILASNVRVEGARLAIVTNGGGPGVMAADRASDLHVPLAELAKETIEKLSEVLPGHWSHSDPVDILGDADHQRYEDATRLVLADKNVDGVLVLLAPQAMTDPTACAEGVIAAAKQSRKPVLACWMGELMVREARRLFGEAGIPQFRSPEAGVDAFGYLACYRRNQKVLLQVPPPLSRQSETDVEGVRLIIENALGDRRSVLSNTESKALLRAFHIPVSPAINVSSAAEALIAAENLGLPVAMKINCPSIEHKSDVSGVRLNINEPRSVRTAFREMMEEVAAQVPEARLEGVTVEAMANRPHGREIMLGIIQDPVFGPVIRFGAGGVASEVFADSQVALPPLNEYLSKQLISGTRMAQFLRKFRNFPEANLAPLVEVLQRISEMACELPEIREMDINPLLVDEQGVIALDARIRVGPPKTSTSRYDHMAIHPYPPELESTWQLPDGSNVVIRPIRPEDAGCEKQFVENLSAESRYFRFMQSLDKLSPLMLARFTQIDYDREMALIAIINEDTPQARILGVVRYVSNSDRHSCEFALTVGDEWQRQGIGRHLLQRLMFVARDRGIEVMEGEVLSNNSKMLRMCQKLGFRIVHNSDEPDVVEVRRHL
ncbi:MAG: bifunctional acetate--CoA ligase family protein/GNAT family N-acetyltransferase [Gammaproteobacteria bacterium SHHR-1]|uniref:bifunctional acetate--CoA ligase family protein/GNAT family N-acetyltransferase n=1 Tax=Magnetovirga frankeli TaxID=947516 RepID=UPI0012931D67|nr:bifunctional acetate--CoA ligase family protein/GNAT family N-acetyltransferase [gamma proteobacterium SS-5]